MELDRGLAGEGKAGYSIIVKEGGAAAVWATDLEQMGRAVELLEGAVRVVDGNAYLRRGFSVCHRLVRRRRDAVEGG
jgi:hypothetical protein